MTPSFIVPNIFTFTFDKPDEDNLGDDIVVRRYTNSELIIVIIMTGVYSKVLNNKVLAA